MDDEEEPSCSCSYSSSKSSSSTSSKSTEYSRKQNRHRSNEKKLINDTDQFDASLLNLQTSSFEPVLRRNNIETKKARPTPIIIEKIVSKPNLSIPILNPKLPEQPLNLSNSVEELNINYVPPSDLSSFSYRINERGEKITKEGNRIVFMDVIQMNTNKQQIDSQSYVPSISHSRSHRQRSLKHVPIIDIQSIERLFNEKNSQNQRRTSINIDNKSKDQSTNTNHLTTSDKLEPINQDYHENPIKLNDQTTQATHDQFESSSTKDQRRKSSIISSTNSSKSETRHRRSRSSLIAGPPINYVERPLIPSSTPSEASSKIQKIVPVPPTLTDEKLNEYLSNIYGTARSIKSNSSSTTHQEIRSLNNPTVENPTYISAFRYMKSSMNRDLFEEYRNAY
jgi:hypothetical protein